MVVTGGARGLGLAICESLATGGARVVVAARDHAAAVAAAAALPTTGPPAVGLQIDTSSWESCSDLFEQVAAIGTVEALVNNAGTDVVGPALERGKEEWDRVLAVNARGYFRCAQLAARAMTRSSVRGSIVNVSSTASLISGADISLYSTSKGAVNSMTRALAAEWGPKGVRVNAVAPGYLEHPLSSGGELDQSRLLKTQIPLGRPGRVEEVGAVVAFLASDSSSYVTGTVLPIDGGLTIV